MLTTEHQLERRVECMKSFLDRGGHILSVPSPNEKCEKLSVAGNTRLVSFIKKAYYFEFFYESKFGLRKRLVSDLGDDAELSAKELLYTFSSPNEPSGLHFVSRVSQIALLFLLLLLLY